MLSDADLLSLRKEAALRSKKFSSRKSLLPRNPTIISSGSNSIDSQLPLFPKFLDLPFELRILIIEWACFHPKKIRALVSKGYREEYQHKQHLRINTSGVNFNLAPTFHTDNTERNIIRYVDIPQVPVVLHINREFRGVSLLNFVKIESPRQIEDWEYVTAVLQQPRLLKNNNVRCFYANPKCDQFILQLGPIRQDPFPSFVATSGFINNQRPIQKRQRKSQFEVPIPHPSIASDSPHLLAFCSKYLITPDIFSMLSTLTIQLDLRSHPFGNRLHTPSRLKWWCEKEGEKFIPSYVKEFNQLKTLNFAIRQRSPLADFRVNPDLVYGASEEGISFQPWRTADIEKGEEVVFGKNELAMVEAAFWRVFVHAHATLETGHKISDLEVNLLLSAPWRKRSNPPRPFNESVKDLGDEFSKVDIGNEIEDSGKDCSTQCGEKDYQSGELSEDWIFGRC